MSPILAVPTAEGAEVMFDVKDGVVAGAEQVGRARSLPSELNMDQALASARPAADAVVAAFRSLSPDDITVEFGIRMDAKVGGVIVRAGMEANMTVTLHWSKSVAPAPDDGA
jgi:hypothetical protein